MAGKTVANIVANFGASAKSKLSNVAISGAPEDQLRGPLEILFHDLAEIGGLPAKAISFVGETTLAHLKTRPDYAVTVNKALVGFVEIKAPGKGADPRRFTDPHDKDQWDKLKSLPNLLYTDGNAFSLWRDGELIGKIVHL
ncbi:MAG: DNA methyltransferase, partial [Bradyrhizobium sp.]|nr:DNA methyltransferase [Bradyrhizobium sp.]